MRGGRCWWGASPAPPWLVPTTFKYYFQCRRADIPTGNPHKTPAHPGPVIDTHAGSHPLSPGKSSHRCKPLGSPAPPFCIAVPDRPLAPVQSNDCTPSHAYARRRALRRVPSPQNPHGIHGPPKSHARRLPTNSPPGKPHRFAASPAALRPAHPPGSNFSAHHPKHNKAIVSGHHNLPGAPAARSAAPQTPPGIRGPPRSRVHRNPRKLPRRKALRCAAGSGPHPHACPPHNNAARRRPTSSAQSIRRPGSLLAAQTPPGSKPGIHGPPKSRFRHTPMNIPAGKTPRWFVFPAPPPPEYSSGSTAVVHHRKSRELVSPRPDCLGPSLLWRRGIPVRTTQPSSSGFAY
jgi:hypothetical protein